MSHNKIKYLCAQPATDYYAWQVEVMINNFIGVGINPNQMIILVAIKSEDTIPESWLKLKNHYTNVNIHFYEDVGRVRGYVSSIRPHIIKQYFEPRPYLQNNIFFYHDCDILFTKNPSEWISNEMLEDDIWYGSDVRFYIGHDYILSKGEDVLDKMCEITKISKEVVRDNELNCIGAQYLLKGINYDFWDWIEKKSTELYVEITHISNIKKEENYRYHALQIWCADMWVLLWKGWLLNKKTVPHPNFNFSWAISSEILYHNTNIMHNAGVVSATTGLFYKANYIDKFPYNIAPEPDRKNTASWYYWKAVQDTAKISVLI